MMANESLVYLPDSCYIQGGVYGNDLTPKEEGSQMDGRLVFEIPDSREVRARLVEAVPSEWTWVSGHLEAPKTFVSAGTADPITGYMFERFHCIKPTVIGRWQESGKRETPDLFAILTGEKLPGFVEFDQAGYGEPAVTLAVAKRFAAFYICKGYLGELHFVSGFRDNDAAANPERCFIFLANGWRYSPFWLQGNPPAIWMDWRGHWGGKEENIRAIAYTCRSFDLKEIELPRRG